MPPKLSVKNFKGIITTSKDAMYIWAREYLVQQKTDWPRANLSVCFDIDDTAIFARGNNLCTEFKQLFDLAVSLGYSIFFVTARPNSGTNRTETSKQLKECKLWPYTHLSMMPLSYMKEPNFSQYKYTERQKISTGKIAATKGNNGKSCGHHIVLTVGDAWGDLFLQQPYQKNAAAIQQENALTTAKNDRLYIGFIPAYDYAWMAIKLPRK